MGPHDPEEDEDDLKSIDNQTCQTGASNLSGSPDTPEPISRQHAHSSSKEQAANCDKNKQMSDARAAASNSQWLGMAPPRASSVRQCSSLSTNNKKVTVEGGNIMIDMEAERGLEASRNSNLSAASARQVRRPDESQFKLPILKSPTPASAASASIASDNVQSSNQRRRVPQRKASVFSHDGFPALDELDQTSLKQHSILSQSLDDLADGIPGDKLANKSHQQQVSDLQIVAQSHQQQVMIAGTSKTSELASAKANSLAHSPQRSARSDTLGSTGSSRASSCDEPTIVSPLLKTSPKKKLDHKSLKQSSPTESSTSSLDSIESDTLPASTIHSARQQGHPEQSCDIVQTNGDETEHKLGRDSQPNVSSQASPVPMETDADSDQLKIRKTSNDSSSTRSDDVFESEAETIFPKKDNKCSLIPPPFESIKNQMKRNSVPDAKAIRQHIDRLISQNEAIMENWNQVSIRSYNSQAASSTSEIASTSASSTRTSPKPSASESTSNFSASGKRPSKQRSSTTALYQGNVFSLQEEQLEQLRLRHSINQQANVNFAAQNQESRRLTQESLEELVGARLRKRSFNNRQVFKRNPVEQTSDTGALSSMMLSPTILEQTATRNLSQSDQFQVPPHFAFGAASGLNLGSRFDPSGALANPLQQNGHKITSAVSRESLGMCFNIDAKHLAERAAELARQSSFSQSIESAIENLSLKRQADRIQQQNLLLNNTNILQQPEDLILATLLAERQRHQQLLEDHIFQQQILHAGKQQEATMPTTLLNYIQLQQQQQALDQQVSLNRIVALEQEYRQQLNDRLLATSLQQQQQQQHQHQTNNQNSLMQSVDRLNERQSRESQLLNEFLAKMMLDRDDPHHHQKSQHGSIVSQSHHNGPILKHSEFNDQRPSDMFTQPLDSATPSHRCEACDISFWTKDLLNYHLMTSCSARTGPDPARPLAFNFNQHNGFDKLASPTSSGQPKSGARLAMSPKGRFGSLDVKIEAADETRGLDMTNGGKRRTENQVFAEAAFQTLCVNQQAMQKDILQSKSVSPPRRRTHHKLDAPDQQQLLIPNKHQQYLQLSAGSTQSGLRLAQLPVAPRSPTFRLQRLDELHRLKHEPLATSTLEVHESNLPIKKRKISEPNMRY